MVRHAAEIEEITKKVLRLVNARFLIKAAYLFGSYADGSPRDDSDIDIAIFADGIASLALDDKMTFLSDIQRQVSNDVELHLFPSETLAELRPSNFPGYIATHGKPLAA